MLNRKKLETDLCVVGGGIAGTLAAISAAREGIRVVLMQERPVLGGNASSEIRMWVCGAGGKNNRETGILEEIALENLYRNPTKNFYLFDTVLLDFVFREKNITLLLNCTCMDAETEEGNFSHGRTRKIRKVTGYQMTTETFFDIEAKFYADCSGDSVLAPLTGAEYREGREDKSEFHEPTYVEKPDALHMGMSLLLQGRETQRPVPFTAPSFATPLTEENFKNRDPDIYRSSENFWYLELGGNRDGIRDTEALSRELLGLSLGTWDYVKHNPKMRADNWELDFLGFLPGKRESRRMVGELIITANDILENRDFPDTVAFGGWPIDDHYPDGFYHKGVPNTNILPPSPYRVPYRALYSRNVDNLYFAGRNISMTHMAMSSLRVMATCGLLGQAVGTAAAIGVKNGLSPQGVYLNKLTDLQNTLMENDSFLPGKIREVSSLCRKTPLENGNDSLRDGRDRPHKIYGSIPCGMKVKKGEALTYRFSQKECVHRVHITFDSDLDRDTLPGDACEKQHMTRCNTCLESPVMHMPLPLCREFVLSYVTGEGKTEEISVKENRKRSYTVPIEKEIISLSLRPLSTWGNGEFISVFSFDFQ